MQCLKPQLQKVKGHIYAAKGGELQALAALISRALFESNKNKKEKDLLRQGAGQKK